jgi:hypothetical protein
MRRTKHGSSESSRISPEIAVNIGHYHHSIEDHIKRIAAEAGDPYLVPHIAKWLSELLSDTALRASSGDSALVPQVWQNGNAAHQRGRPQSRYDDASATGALYAGASLRRPLKKPVSAEARERIAEAQRKRWAKQKRQGDNPQKRYWAAMTPEQRRKEMKKRGMGSKGNYGRSSSGMAKYWAKMTAEQRSAEMARRIALARAKRGGKSA